MQTFVSVDPSPPKAHDPERDIFWNVWYEKQHVEDLREDYKDSKNPTDKVLCAALLEKAHALNVRLSELVVSLNSRGLAP